MTPAQRVKTVLGCGRGLVIGYTNGIVPMLWRCGQYHDGHGESLYCRDCLKRLETRRTDFEATVAGWPSRREGRAMRTLEDHIRDRDEAQPGFADAVERRHAAMVLADRNRLAARVAELEAEKAELRDLLDEARFHVTVEREEHGISQCSRCNLYSRIDAALAATRDGEETAGE